MVPTSPRSCSMLRQRRQADNKFGVDRVFRLHTHDRCAIRNHKSHHHGSLRLVGFSCGTSPRPPRPSQHLPFQTTSSLLCSRRTGSLRSARFISATLMVCRLLMNGLSTHEDDITQRIRSTVPLMLPFGTTALITGCKTPFL